jgi:hypothetical protein
MTLLIAEGIIRTIDPQTNCAFIEHEIFNKYNYFEKKQLCYEFTTIDSDFTSPIRLLVPNQSGEYLNVNSDGFRGEEFDFQDDDYKIFVLGGSTLFGFITNGDEFTIPAILEKKFKENDINVKIINAGIPGGHSRSEVYYLQNHILEFSPNMVIMYDGLNDGGEILYDFTDTEFENNNYFENNNLKYSESGRTGLLSFFAKIDYQTGMGGVQFFKSLINTSGTNAIDNSPANVMQINNLEDKFFAKAERLEGNWDKICSIGKDQGFKTINIIQPGPGTSDRIVPYTEEIILQQNSFDLQFLNLLNLNNFSPQNCEHVFDLRNTFEGMDEISIFFDSTHMDNFGNEVVANKIYEKILPIVIKDIKK